MIRTPLLRPALVLGLALALAGCATPRAPSASLAANAATAQTVHDYRGRFSVRYEQNGETRNIYGNFQWHEQDDAVTLRLLDPLGQTLAVVTEAPASATLELPNRAPQTAPDVNELMQRALGFSLPVAGLQYWLKPMPAPGAHARAQTDPATGRLSHLVQDGWRIDYLAYQDAPATGVKRIDLTRDEPPLGIKLVVDP